MHFMSIEVSAQSFLFAPGQPSDAEAEIRRIEQQGAIQKNEPAELPFAHIHLHDLESLWWVAVWIVFYNEFRAPQQSDADTYPDLKDIDRHVALAQNLFPPLMESTRRHYGFQLHFHKIFKDLPESKHTACEYLDVLRRYLIMHYKKVEATLPHSIDVPTFKGDTYNTFRRVFGLLQALEFTLAFIPDIRRELRGNLKRPRAESTNDTGVASQKRR